jgi:hypothetical protein
VRLQLQPRSTMSSFRYVITAITQAYVQTLDTAVRDRDAESLEHIVVSMFDFHLDYQQAPQLRGVRDEYVSMAKSSLATKQVSLTCHSLVVADQRSIPLPSLSDL